jgi:ABC-type transport system involved in multi-copper enzyme maturation permease subunit
VKALFVKEYRQGHLLVWLGFLLAALIAVLHRAWEHGYVKTAADLRELDQVCAGLLLVAAGVFVMGGAAGLFATESARGTLPFLLGLPLSRTRIWLAKLLAGLALAASAVLLTIVPNALLIPGAMREMGLRVYFPDYIIWAFLLFSTTLFWSTLLTRAMSVLLASLAAAVASLVGLVAASQLGLSLLGYDGFLDIGLWALVWAVALFFASWLTFRRAELLQSRRKWPLAFVSLIAVGGLISCVVIAGVRFAVRYQRTGVQQMEAVSVPPGGSVATLWAYGDRVATGRNVGRGWGRSGNSAYRSKHTIALDLETGRELWVGSALVQASASPDGRYLAAGVGRAAVTWRASRRDLPTSAIEVWDLREHRRVYRGPPPGLTDRQTRAIGSLAWSPKGNWLAVRAGLTAGDEAGGGIIEEALLLMRPDGSQPVEVVLTKPSAVSEANDIASWAWAADGEAMYTLSAAGALGCRALPGGSATRIWRAPAVPEDYRWWFNSLAPSPATRPAGKPSRRWIAASGFSVPPHDSPSSPVLEATWVVAADGTGAVPIAGARADELIWSRDGECLYVLWHPAGRSAELLRWREGDLQAFPLGVPFPDLSRAAAAHMWQVQAVGLPDRGLLLWGPGGVGRVDAQGRFSYAAAAVRALAPEYRFIALDRQGRAIVTSDRRLLAVDVAAGSITTIYP